MTRVSIVNGNLALALTFDPSESRSSRCIVIIGGVVSSLILTLALVPNVYAWRAPTTKR
jgi:multidrug efflux pump subunit AcrB